MIFKRHTIGQLHDLFLVLLLGYIQSEAKKHILFGKRLKHGKSISYIFLYIYPSYKWLKNIYTDGSIETYFILKKVAKGIGHKL